MTPSPIRIASVDEFLIREHATKSSDDGCSGDPLGGYVHVKVENKELSKLSVSTYTHMYRKRKTKPQDSSQGTDTTTQRNTLQYAEDTRYYYN